jgi:acetyltransferase-like isoleucine patch superfamily enzyme
VPDPLQLLPRILTELYSIWVSSTYPFASKGHDLSIRYTCNLSRRKAHRAKLGNSVLIMRDTLIEVNAPPEQNAELTVMIDENVSIGFRCQISAKDCIHLERDVLVAQSVLMIDYDRPYEDGRLAMGQQGASQGGRIRIGQGFWIGSGALITYTSGELVLGRSCVVGANALVTGSFPPYSVIGGNPARIVRQVNGATNKWMRDPMVP